MKLNKMISWIAVIIWMLIIFHLSSQVAGQSNQLSVGITKIVVDIFNNIFHSADLDINAYNHIIRKNAHFFAYLILGILAANVLSKNEHKGVFIVLVFCIIYAISDETHQMFVPGRGPGLKDVIIDSAGAGVGIIIYLGVGKILNKRNKKNIKS